MLTKLNLMCKKVGCPFKIAQISSVYVNVRTTVKVSFSWD